MDIKDSVERILSAVCKDKALEALFQKEPLKAVEKILGEKLPADVMEKIAQGVRAKLTADKAGDVLGGLKKLF